MKLKNNQAGVAHLAALLVVVVIVVIGLVGWRVWDNSKNNTATSSTSNTTADSSSSLGTKENAKTVDETKDWKTYNATLKTGGVQATTYKFSFKYPADWKVSSSQYVVELYSPDFKSRSGFSGISSGSAFTISADTNEVGVNNHVPTLSEKADNYMGVTDKKAITVGGLPALQFSDSGQGQYSQLVTLVSRDALVYTFAQMYTKGMANPAPNLMTGVLASLKF